MNNTIEFKDGETFNLSGQYRIEQRKDGHYVVGNGFLCPVDSYEEGQKMIDSLTKENK